MANHIKDILEFIYMVGLSCLLHLHWVRIEREKLIRRWLYLHVVYNSMSVKLDGQITLRLVISELVG